MTPVAEQTVNELTAEVIKLRAERDRARNLAAALAGSLHTSYGLLWQGIGDQSSHGEQLEWGRRVAAFLRENAADAGPDRLPMPKGWESS